MIDTNPKLNKANKKRIQQIVGSFLYYARTVNPTINTSPKLKKANKNASKE
jgi:hypothetical protein